MRVVCIKGSLNKKSRTAIVMDYVISEFKRNKVKVEVIDLREIKMQFCDGRPIEKYNKDMQNCIKIMKKSDFAVIGMPVYQYSVAGPLKNFLDITVEALYYKYVGIVANSGGVRSYLAANDLMKLLTFEAWCKPLMPIVHSWAGDFDDQKLTNEKVREKADQMVKVLIDTFKKN